MHPAAAQAAVAPLAGADLTAAPCDRTSADHDRTAADRVLAGWLDVPGFAPVQIGTGPHIDWNLDPYGHPSWVARFRDLTWVQPLLRRAGAADAYRQRAETILRDFLAQNPLPAAAQQGPLWDPTLTAKRTETLLCATVALGHAKWLSAGLSEHGTVLAERWSGAWNRGTMEIRALLALGCLTGNDSWVELAKARVAESFSDQLPGPVIGVDGSTNEQALGYGHTVYWLWQQIARELAACGGGVPDVLRARVPLLLQFLADATMPNGHLVPLGDTFASAAPPRAKGTVGEYAATLGEQGALPDHVVGMYPGGYVFGRSGWGTERPFGAESFYSLRFGPGRQFHGHNDHQALTWYVGGRQLLVDSGHDGYLAGPYRDYLRSARAHNVLLASESPLDASAPTTLQRYRLGDAAQYFEVTDQAIGAARTRDVLFLQQPDAIVVLDRVRGGPVQKYDQLWHLAPELQIAEVDTNAVRAYAPDGAGLAVLRIPLPLEPSGASTEVKRGESDPYQGWVSGGLFERHPASVVALSQVGRDPTFLTVLMSADRATSVHADFRGLPALGGVLTLRQGRSQVHIYLGADGTLTRL
ncbi:MAG TPA: heparinase II/III family protein [Sporichthya sp.]|nr:heparinase II/III family protein [Sporichthya sp.]